MSRVDTTGLRKETPDPDLERIQSVILNDMRPILRRMRYSRPFTTQVGGARGERAFPRSGVVRILIEIDEDAHRATAKALQMDGSPEFVRATLATEQAALEGGHPVPGPSGHLERPALPADQAGRTTRGDQGGPRDRSRAPVRGTLMTALLDLCRLARPAWPWAYWDEAIPGLVAAHRPGMAPEHTRVWAARVRVELGGHTSAAQSWDGETTESLVEGLQRACLGLAADCRARAARALSVAEQLEAVWSEPSPAGGGPTLDLEKK